MCQYIAVTLIHQRERSTIGKCFQQRGINNRNINQKWFQAQLHVNKARRIQEKWNSVCYRWRQRNPNLFRCNFADETIEHFKTNIDQKLIVLERA